MPVSLIHLLSLALSYLIGEPALACCVVPISSEGKECSCCWNMPPIPDPLDIGRTWKTLFAPEGVLMFKLGLLKSEVNYGFFLLKNGSGDGSLLDPEFS